jgi:branched-chain amino acid transport system ATP-binding protein
MSSEASADAPSARRETASAPLLAVTDLNGYYGPSHVLQDVSFEVGSEPVAIIGRNGMGKSTLCLALMGLLRSARGSVRFGGEELLGRPPYRVAAAGIGYVPQGRRLFPSLTVAEHLRLVAKQRSGNGGMGGVDRAYELFPRLAERRSTGAGDLSGGEQQMLAIARALLLDPKLLIMDEPSEGLAPAVVEHLLEVIRELSGQGTALLVVEQNLGVAVGLAERQLVMIAGRIAAETTAQEIESDPDAQRRYLGVEAQDGGAAQRKE